jgi:hypothetical protein
MQKRESEIRENENERGENINCKKKKKIQFHHHHLRANVRFVLCVSCKAVDKTPSMIARMRNLSTAIQGSRFEKI